MDKYTQHSTHQSLFEWHCQATKLSPGLVSIA